jgi:hypothetical protein
MTMAICSPALPTGAVRAIVWRGMMLIATFVSVIAISDRAHAQATRTVYDGSWNVMITADVGECTPYNVQIQIEGGRLLPQAGAEVSGSVSRSGEVAVRVSSGASFASGNGKLSSAFGRGRWSGRGSAGFCKGRWTARRGYS